MVDTLLKIWDIPIPHPSAGLLFTFVPFTFTAVPTFCPTLVLPSSTGRTPRLTLPHTQRYLPRLLLLYALLLPLAHYPLPSAPSATPALPNIVFFNTIPASHLACAHCDISMPIPYSVYIPLYYHLMPLYPDSAATAAAFDLRQCHLRHRLPACCRLRPNRLLSILPHRRLLPARDCFTLVYSDTTALLRPRPLPPGGCIRAKRDLYLTHRTVTVLTIPGSITTPRHYHF